MYKKYLKTIEVAQRLIDLKFYTQSVHCSYYAVRQLMQYKLANTDNRPMSYELQEVEFKECKSSHEALLMEIKNRISNPKEAKKFCEAFRNLRSCRVDADYTKRLFSDEDSCECKSQADSLISKLNNYFKQ